LKEPHQRFVQLADVKCFFQATIYSQNWTDFTIELSSLTSRTLVLYKEPDALLNCKGTKVIYEILSNTDQPKRYLVPHEYWLQQFKYAIYERWKCSLSFW